MAAATITTATVIQAKLLADVGSRNSATTVFGSRTVLMPYKAEGDEEQYADRDQPLANHAWSGEHLTCRSPGQPETADTHN